MNSENQNKETKNSRNQNSKQHVKQSANEKARNAGFIRLTQKQISRGINHYENIISTEHLSLVPKQNDVDKKQHPQAFYRKRLNAIDSTILEDVAYKALDNPEFILEKRIENLENELSLVIEKLDVSKTINNDAESFELENQKQELEKNIKALKNNYKSQSLETGLTCFLTDIFTFPQRIKKIIKTQVKMFLRQSKFVKSIKPLFRAIMIRDTLGKLNKINKSIDELVKMKTPVGEDRARYETLIKHLNQACSLHSQIRKELK